MNEENSKVMDEPQGAKQDVAEDGNAASDSAASDSVASDSVASGSAVNHEQSENAQSDSSELTDSSEQVTALGAAFGEALQVSGEEEASNEEAQEETEAQEEAAATEDRDTQEEALDAAAMSEEKPKRDDLGWYVVHVYSGFEKKVKMSLEERIRSNNMDEFFGDIHIPEETVVELVRGEKKTSSKKFFPGYILVELVLNEDTWHIVNDTPKVTGFVGDHRNPLPLTPDEVGRIKNQEEEGAQSPRARMAIQAGDKVKVVDGPFADFSGSVEELCEKKQQVTVLITIFGRATPVVLDFVQVQKQS